MTTAHRPTWKAAVGQANEGGWTAGGAVSHQTSVLDAPAHLTLKTRTAHQLVADKKATLAQSLLALQDAEANAVSSKQKIPLRRRTLNEEETAAARRKLEENRNEIDVATLRLKYHDEDHDIDDDGGGDRSSSSESDLDGCDDDDSDDDSDLDSDEDEEDEEAALQAELAKIRAERQEAQQKQQEAQQAAEQSELQQAAVLGNPLLNTSAAGTSSNPNNKQRRRWNDDAVFRHQAKNEPAPKKRFINDTVRNDFHKRFLNKFIR